MSDVNTNEAEEPVTQEVATQEVEQETLPAPKLKWLIRTSDGVFVGRGYDNNLVVPDDCYAIDALDENALPFGMVFDKGTGTFEAPPPPPAPNRSTDELKTYANSKQESLLAGMWSFNVGTNDTPVTVTTHLNDRGQAAMTQLLLWAALLAGPNDVQHYNMADGSPGPDINPQQAILLAGKAGAIKSASIKALNDIAVGIENGTIKTFEDIDAFDWPKSE